MTNPLKNLFERVIKQTRENDTTIERPKPAQRVAPSDTELSLQDILDGTAPSNESVEDTTPEKRQERLLNEIKNATPDDYTRVLHLVITEHDLPEVQNAAQTKLEELVSAPKASKDTKHGQTR